MSTRLHPLDDQVSAVDESTRAGSPRGWVQRLSFVIILMGVGALIGAFISDQMTTRYKAEAVLIVAADTDAASLLDDSDQASFSGDDGTELRVSASGNVLSFAGSATKPSQAASIANTAADTFVAAHSGVTIVGRESARPPDSPASPNRLRTSLIGVAAGALIGLALQTALRPPARDDSVSYVPSWTDPSIDLTQQESAADTSPGPAMRTLWSEEPLARTVSSGTTPADAGLTEDTAPTNNSDIATLILPPDPDGVAMTDRSSSGIFGALLASPSDLGESSTDHDQAQRDTLARRDTTEVGGTTESVQAPATGLDATGDTDELSGADGIQAHTFADPTHSLSDPGDEIRPETQPDRQDLGAETGFLRAEVARYQDSLDAERIDHATVLATVRLAHQDELDRIHSEHRTTLNQLAQSNRNLLTTQRNEAEAMMAALEAQHQTALDDAHVVYEERLRQARAHLTEQLASSHDRAASDAGTQHEAEVAAIREQLDSAVRNHRQTQERLEALLKDQDHTDRRAEHLKARLDQTSRSGAGERRRLELRIQQLEALVTKSEERLAQERRRTSEVVRNLLQESASSAAEADWARKHLLDGQRTADDNHEQEIAVLMADAKAFERAAAQREIELEATISSLLARIAAATSAPESS